jgi:hypothetical protein
MPAIQRVPVCPIDKLAKPPRVDEDEIIPFTVDEAQRILSAAEDKRKGVRFAIALSLGLRKGRHSD